MRKVLPLVLLSWLNCSLAGCQSVVKPLEPRPLERADDPLLSTAEQKRKARYLHAYPDEELGPRSGSGERPPFEPHNQ